MDIKTKYGWHELYAHIEQSSTERPLSRSKHVDKRQTTWTYAMQQPRRGRMLRLRSRDLCRLSHLVLRAIVLRIMR